MTAARQQAVTAGTASAAVVAGTIVALQLQSNAMLSVAVRSAPLAAVVAFATGAGAIGVTLLATRRGRAGADSARSASRRGVEPWWLLGGVSSAAYVLVSAAAAPVLGLTFLTLGLVAGQLVGSLVADALGVSPQGRMRANAPRILSAVAGVFAISLASRGPVDARLGEAPSWVVASGILVVGACSSFGVAANGRLGVRLGDPLRAALMSLVVALVLCTAVAAVGFLSAGVPLMDLPADVPPVAWIGGVLGAVWVVVSVRLVRTLGVLILLVGALTGQLVGSVALDLAAPLGGQHVDPSRASAVVIMALALALALWGSRPRS